MVLFKIQRVRAFFSIRPSRKIIIFPETLRIIIPVFLPASYYQEIFIRTEPERHSKVKKKTRTDSPHHIINGRVLIYLLYRSPLVSLIIIVFLELFLLFWIISVYFGVDVLYAAQNGPKTVEQSSEPCMMIFTAWRTSRKKIFTLKRARFLEWGKQRGNLIWVN